MPRLLLTFSRGEEIKYLSHLDLMRLWERALRRSGLPLAYTQGFSPHPRLSLAAPLAVGVTSERELLELFLEQPVPLARVMKQLVPQLPQGLELLEVREIPLSLPSLPSQVRFAEYRVVVEAEASQKEVLQRLQELLARESLPWHHLRDTGPRHYDLRPLIQDLWLKEWRPPSFTLGMRLRCDSGATGRPEQVVAALGFDPLACSPQRTRLLLA